MREEGFLTHPRRVRSRVAAWSLSCPPEAGAGGVLRAQDNSVTVVEFVLEMVSATGRRNRRRPTIIAVA